jgi:hypothetical protein
MKPFYVAIAKKRMLAGKPCDRAITGGPDSGKVGGVAGKIMDVGEATGNFVLICAEASDVLDLLNVLNVDR